MLATDLLHELEKWLYCEEIRRKNRRRTPSMTTDGPLTRLLNRIRGGDPAAVDGLFEHTRGRFAALARRMFRDDRVGRWIEVDDFIQDGSIRLLGALRTNPPVDEGSFYRQAATILRRELIDLARRFFGPEGLGTHYASLAGCGPALDGSGSAPHLESPPESSCNPERLGEWAEFHDAVGRLPDEQRVLFDLLWYGDMSQEKAAEMLGIPFVTLRRRWRTARLELHEKYGDQLPF
jgi:RNA polymerase sigma factor (sigma-70 family)